MKKIHLILLSSLGVGALVLYFLVKPAKAEPVPPIPPIPPAPPSFVEEVARYYNPTISVSLASEIARSVAKWTKERNVNVFSVLAIIAQESHFKPSVTGGVGERGLMQLSQTALDELKRVYGVTYSRDRLYEVDYNIMVGTHYYLYCVRLAEGDRFEAIARYNKTTRWWEAKDYANLVLTKRAKILEIYGKFK